MTVPQAPRPVRLGMLTPSSNTVLEPLTAAMLAGLPHVTAHFSRFRVTEIALGAGALAQFGLEPILDAARLLADARVDVIAWSGTSASWLGFDSDEALCRRIEQETGARATTAVLALNEAMRLRGVRRFGLVTPYLDDVQARIVQTYAASGLACAAERHRGLQDNFAFATVTAAQLDAMAREVARAGPDAIAVVCTNLRAAPLAAPLERELGLPLYDSVAATVWKSLLLAGVDPRQVTGWGSLFQLTPG